MSNTHRTGARGHQHLRPMAGGRKHGATPTISPARRAALITSAWTEVLDGQRRALDMLAALAPNDPARKQLAWLASEAADTAQEATSSPRHLELVREA